MEFGTIFCDNQVPITILSFYYCSFDELNMSNHSLTARGTDLPFSHKSAVSVAHEQNIVGSKTLICRSRFGLSAN